MGPTRLCKLSRHRFRLVSTRVRQDSVNCPDIDSAVSGYVTESTEKIQRVEIGRSVTYSVIGVDLRKMYDPDRVTLSFIPVEGKEREKCIAEWKAEFEQLTPATPPHKVRDAALGFLKIAIWLLPMAWSRPSASICSASVGLLVLFQ
ncbi:hypothetical protein HYC85_025949 [Camellia sinensis]|uniref:Bet v I/Major latex protein domain-containing protein n=1 Tax=Camellia sinensis TaxID=4442 RepID=A0A7J7G271_CAMSI|nr:hypothetical protein HYC85_025949 [Camellia sinensis]